MTQSSFANRRPTLALMFCVVLVATIASLGALAPPGEWYAGLRKPWFNPPAWVFGPAWTVLYLMIAVATWRLWRAPASAARTLAQRLNAVQLALNAAWTPLFFGLKLPGVAFVEIIVMWGFIATTIWAARRVDRTAAGLLLPYLAWVTFAATLNGCLWWLNRAGG